MPKSGCSCRQAGVIFLAWISIAIFPFVSGFVEGPSCTTHRRWFKGRHRDSALPSRTSAPARPTIGMVAAEPVAGLLNTVTVDLEDRSYPIYIGSGILERSVCVKLLPVGFTRLMILPVCRLEAFRLISIDWRLEYSFLVLIVPTCRYTPIEIRYK